MTRSWIMCRTSVAPVDVVRVIALIRTMSHLVLFNERVYRGVVLADEDLSVDERIAERLQIAIDEVATTMVVEHILGARVAMAVFRYRRPADFFSVRGSVRVDRHGVSPIMSYTNTTEGKCQPTFNSECRSDSTSATRGRSAVGSISHRRWVR